MKPFVIVLSLKPAVRLPQNLGRLELNFAEPDGLKKVWISKIEENIKGTPVQIGLRFRVFLNAQDIRAAIDSAKGLTDGIVSFLIMVTGRGMETPREEIAYELTPDVQERDFVQIFYDVPFKSASRRQVDPKSLIDFIDRQMKLEAPFSEHLIRAIRWYRMGAMVTDIFDQFNCFWIGLEALNPLLQQKLSVKDDPTTCPKCGHRWISTHTVSGIRVFVQNKMEEGKTLYQNIRQLRNYVIHSTKGLHNLRESVAIYAPKIGETLFRAICYASGFEEWATMTYGIILKEFPARLELQCWLVGGEPPSLGPDGQDPHFELNYEVTETKLGENGSLTYNVDYSFKAVTNPNVQWRPQETRLYGDPEIKGVILSKTVRTAGGEETPI